MNSPEFELLEVVEPQARIVAVRGEFDLHTASKASRVLSIASADPERVLVIDLTACTFLDSTALATIVGAARALTNGQMRIAIACQPGSNALAVLELAGIDRTIPVLPTVERALTAALATD